MKSLMAHILPQRAELGKLLRLQDEVLRRTVVVPEDYLRRAHPDDLVENSPSLPGSLSSEHTEEEELGFQITQ